MSTKTKTLLALSAMLLATILTASAATALPERFVEISNGELVIRYPQKARVGKNFNIGIYVADSLVGNSEGNYTLAELHISVSGPEDSTCVMWNDWFEFNETYGPYIGPDEDLIVEPFVIGYLPGDDGMLGTEDDVPIFAYSMEYDEAVSKLGDVPGWTGSVVCRADTAGEYTFTLTDADGNTIGEFTVEVVK